MEKVFTKREYPSFGYAKYKVANSLEGRNGPKIFFLLMFLYTNYLASQTVHWNFDHDKTSDFNDKSYNAIQLIFDKTQWFNSYKAYTW